jgi:Spy/CpxP family protein refolding chaperone
MSKTRTTVIATIALLATFLVGALVGIAADRVWIYRAPQRRADRTAEFMMKRLDRRLDLSAEQEREITAILKRSHQRVAAVWGGVHPRLRQELERTNGEIARVLTPEQQAEFEKIKMRMTPRRRPPRR